MDGNKFDFSGGKVAYSILTDEFGLCTALFSRELGSNWLNEDVQSGILPF